MDPLMDVIKNSQEPEWLERPVVGELRLWQIVFLCLACLTAIIVMVCCCFRFRIPRTKQQIEADYQRRQITAKFRQRLEGIHDTSIDAMSLRDGSLDAESGPKEPPPPTQAQAPTGLSFVKFASSVATLTKLGSKTPSPDPSASKMDF